MQATVQSMKPEAMLADPAAVDALTIAHKMLVSAALTTPVIPQQAGQLLPAQQPLTAAYDLPTIGRNFDSGPARYEPDNRLWACGYFGRAPTHGVRSTGTGRPRGRAPKGMEWSAELRQWVRPESGEGAEPAAATAITGKRGLPEAARAAGSAYVLAGAPSSPYTLADAPIAASASPSPPIAASASPFSVPSFDAQRAAAAAAAAVVAARASLAPVGVVPPAVAATAIASGATAASAAAARTAPRAVPRSGKRRRGASGRVTLLAVAAANARSGKGGASRFPSEHARPPARPLARRGARKLPPRALPPRSPAMVIGDLCVSLEIKGGDSHGAAAQYSECLPREPNEACEPRPPPGFVMQLRTCSHRLSRCTDSLGPALVVARPPGGGDGRKKDLPVLVVFVGRVDVLVTGPVAEGEALVPSGRNDGFAVSAARARGLTAATDSLLTIGEALSSCGPGPHVVKCDVRWDKRMVREADAPHGPDLDIFVATAAAACAQCATPRHAAPFDSDTAHAGRPDVVTHVRGPAAAAPAVPSSRVETCKLTLRVHDGWCEPPATKRSRIESRGLSTHLMHPADEGCESPTTPDTRTLRAAILTAHDSRRGSDDSRTGRIVRNDGEQYSHEAPRLEEQAEAAALLREFLNSHTAAV